ncbi:uncharacterized protein LOC131155691 isoform X1 [Malania oleifera]|uniref:uncharacterized protein LOC131155691 isoform X1 n=1 Tax=Malania oleifera TaxID=397392 RepID=UPI0025AE00C1|nr:uncharacterized protein LOC131155691 isoform X1 [Malania oleifera]
MAAMAGQKHCSLESGHYLGEISALCFLHLPPHLSSSPYLLAGTGSQMLLYDLDGGKLLKSFHVFKGIRVHGISCSFTNCVEEPLSSMLAFKIAVFGERRVKLFTLSIEMVLRPQNHMKVWVDLVLLHLLPKYSHWVLDVCFLKDCITSLREGRCFLAVGCSDNSVGLWDIQRSCVILEARCPERCLLYSMRLWGEELEALCIASGTIYNEIIVWKLVPQTCGPYSANLMKDQAYPCSSFENTLQRHGQQYEAVCIHRLAGHEGSIFRIAWSSNGSKLISVSDDRSARIWTVHAGEENSNNSVEGISSNSADFVFFGHDARVWDCFITDSLIVTAGEDCTCRVWGPDGKQLKMVKEHIGRGIWRCLYDPSSSLLITAGFDSAIKVHRQHAPFSRSVEQPAEGVREFTDKTQIFTSRIPKSSEHTGLMDSKSEYVRCLHFAREDVFYVATNCGYIYHAKLSVATGHIKWSQLVQVSQQGPIICMDFLSGNLSEFSGSIEDWIAVGDGKGNMTIVRVGGDVSTPDVDLTFSWLAERERQLLRTYWCKSLGNRYIFTADPRGTLKLWRLSYPILSVLDNSVRSCSVSLLAEFVSCFGIRIMCLDASFEEEVLVCGDLRGNMLLFPLMKALLLGDPINSDGRISPLSYFRGAHGISSVSSISIAEFNPNQIEICSTGGDGCICHMEYDRIRQNLDFIGMRQVKELSLIESVSPDGNSVDDLGNNNYAKGFASADFIIWNLKTETKVLQVSCGGWRRPHSYYLGDVPEMKHCFVYIKDEIIFIHRHCVLDGEKKIYPQNLHVQFHGREMHCLCFVTEDSESDANGLQSPISRSSWIATGCEDGTVRLTRYTPGVENWSASKLLGEHVGGSAVRSICSASKMHILAANVTDVSNGSSSQVPAWEGRENPLLLISVGAKRVLTSWKLRNRRIDEKDEALNGNGFKPSSVVFSSMSFKWLSTDMPTKYSKVHKKAEDSVKIVGAVEHDSSVKTHASSRSLFSENREMECLKDKYENDWRYLAVTAFLVKNASSRFTVCFVVVACSDATLVLRALILPFRFWFDVALLVPLSSPVLALQHVIIPAHLSSKDNTQSASAFIVISGSTDGSIAFWELSECIIAFMQRVSTFNTDSIDCQKRPRTGRGSQGGRLWRSLSCSAPKNKPHAGLLAVKAETETNGSMHNHVVCGTSSKSGHPENNATAHVQDAQNRSLELEVKKDDFFSEICEIQPLHVLNNVHQSGVNCLHVSQVNNGQSFGSVYDVLSGGDDQSLHCIRFDLALLPACPDSNVKIPDLEPIAECDSMKNVICSGDHKSRIRFLYHNSIASAHSSAVKGIWADGSWVFSTGLDQRVRCWQLEKHGKLTEREHLIISVPEPEALDARACGRDYYQIAVAGRGMQMVEFSASAYTDGGE